MKQNPHICYRIILALLAPILFITAAELLCGVFNAGHPTRFLIEAEHKGEEVWIDNQLFGYRYFAPAVSRAPAPIVLPKEKDENELRIVILGESAAMGEPEPAFGPARILELMLQEQLPDRKVRVINAAMTAINSHVIREIARDLKRMQPDYVICYIGNNEVVGPYGPGTVFGAFSSSHTANRLRSLSTRLRLSSAARSFRFRLSGDDDSRWQGMEMFTEFHVKKDDARLENVYQSFSKNLSAIVSTIRKAGATPVISTVAVNLADQAPLDGTIADAFRPATTTPSLAQYKFARDADSMRFRADSEINRMIRQLSERDSELVFVDAESAFEENSVPGNNIFLDHVHFNLSGAYNLAALFNDAVFRTLSDREPDPPTFQSISKRIGWNPYSSLETAEIILERLSRPPFTAALDHAEHMSNWTMEIANIHRQICNTSIENVFRTLLDNNPTASNDPHNVYLALRASLFEDRFTLADSLIKQLRAQFPHRADIRSWDALISAINGSKNDPWEILTKDAPDLGEIPADMLISTSETLFQSNYREEAIAFLRLAVKHFPHRTRAQGLLATRMAQAGNMADALRIFEQLHENHPDADWINEEYGLLLALNGNVDQAEDVLSHLTGSSDPDERLKYIQFLLYKQDVASAVSELMEQLKRHPNHAETERMLSYVMTQKGQFNSALTYINDVIRIEPWNGVDRVRRGSLYDSLNKPAQAILAYESALPYLTNPTEVMRSMSWILATDNLPYVRNPQRALRNMKRILELYPEQDQDPYTLHVLAAALAAGGQYESAVAEIDRALELKSRLNHALTAELQQARELFKRGESIRINRDSDRNP